MTATWTPITKGDRKPPGYVLVTHSYESDLDFYEPLIITRIYIARWNPHLQYWEAVFPRKEKFDNVTAWMPLPEPYKS
jgi:hypothetical protein